MKFPYILIVSFLFISSSGLFAQIPSSQHVDSEIHERLLANAKSHIHNSVIQGYIKSELEVKEPRDPHFGNLSQESIDMIGDLLSEANSHSGKKYRSGAKGPANFDCSGFTRYVYNQFGYKLKASSRDQYSDGVAVETGDLRPGDLVFFTGRNVKGNIGHVGIVVNADNENHTFSFIHAAVAGGIKIDRSSAPYYEQRYVGARRIITE